MGHSKEDLIRCTDCGRGPRPDANADDNWRVEPDGLGGLHLFCAECWQREFGPGSQDLAAAEKSNPVSHCPPVTRATIIGCTVTATALVVLMAVSACGGSGTEVKAARVEAGIKSSVFSKASGIR